MPSHRSLRRLILLPTCLVAFAFAFAFSAGAQSETESEDEKKSKRFGGYLEYTAGLALVPNQNLDGRSTNATGSSGGLQMKGGYVIGAAVGAKVYEYDKADLRTEIALNFRNNDVKQLRASPDVTGTIPIQESGASGDVRLLAAMINAYVDYELEYGINPYVGLGIGYGRIEIDAENKGALMKINDQASVLVWNFMIGATIPYSDTVDFTGGYRYVDTTDPQMKADISGVGVARYDTEFDAHELTVGIRIKF